MLTIAIDDAPRVDTPHGVDVRKVHETDHTQVMHIRLEPGEALRWHITPVDAFFYIVSGQATVEIGDERSVLSAHVLVHSPAGVKHRVVNEGDEPCRFLVVKTPRPADSTRLL